MKNKYSIIFICLFACLVFWQCSVSSSYYENDYTYLYDNNQKLIKPLFKVFHFHQDSSIIYFQLNTSDILYGKFNSDTNAKAHIRLKYRLTELNNANLIDSSTISLFDFGQNDQIAQLQGKIKIPTKLENRYQLEIRLRDEYKDLNVIHQIQIDKRLNGSSQYYLLKNKGKVLFYQYSPDTTVSLFKSPLIRYSKFILETSNQIIEKASPPFAINESKIPEFESDYSEEIIFTGDSVKLELKDKITRLSPLSNSNSNYYYIYYHYQNYPKVTDYIHLIEPLRYISTNSEYNALLSAEDKRKAFEEFWLNFARNKIDAKKLIAEYYQRVELANTYFSSNKEGWKTDRGIILIVYGKPSRVQRFNNIETWLYGEENTMLSIKFEFRKEKTEWTANRYTLVRNEIYKNNWYQAVDVWRQGRINL